VGCGDKILDKEFENIDAEIGNWKKAGCKNVTILWTVTTDWVWIGNWIYWTLTQLETTSNYSIIGNSLQYT
jgi:hypothetical protein